MNKRLHHLKKTILISFFALIIILVLVAAAGYSFFQSRVPKLSGQIELKGLSTKVTVIRDSFGIPHIEAGSNVDAYRVLGYIMASERLFQMEMQRRMASGELSEVFGDKTLEVDKLFRTLGMKFHSEKQVKERLQQNLFHPEMIAEANAFFDGVNQFQNSGPLPVEFTLLGLKPRPFTLADAQAFIGVMSYSFGTATFQDPLFTKMRNRLGSDLVEELRSGGFHQSKKETRTVFQHSPHIEKIYDTLESLQGAFTLFEGSNGWIVSGERSESGHPLLASDPHISYSHPGVWFEAHIKTPTFENYGHYLAIVPFAVQGHNREKGWGFTMSLTDDMDLYAEKVDWGNRSYSFKGRTYPLETRKEIIKVKGQEDVEIFVHSTGHGPLLKNGILEGDISLKWSYLDSFKTTSKDLVSVLFGIGRAQTMSEMKEAIADGKAPGLNILYADKKNIGWWMFGDVILRKKDLKSDFILDGASGEDEPLGLMKFEDKPHLENPVDGIIVSANSRPETFPRDPRGDFQPDYRQATIKQILAQKSKWSLDEFKMIQPLSMNFENKIVLGEMLNLTAGQSFWREKAFDIYLDELRKWDFESRADSRAALLYYSWCGELIRLLLEADLSKDEYQVFTKTANDSYLLRRILFDKNSLWWKNREPEKLLAVAFERSIERLKKDLGSDAKNWKWGALHSLEFVHPIGRVRPLNYLFNLGPYPLGGATQEINNQRYIGLNFSIKAGPSTRRLIDFSRPERAYGILPTGNSGHLLSPHYKDQLDLFLKGDYRGEWLDAQDYSRNLDLKERTLHFNPAG